MRARYFLASYFSLVLLVFGTSALAESLSLSLTDDAHIAGDVSIWLNADDNFGSKTDIFVHNYGPKYGLVRFDAASISGQVVNSATLELYLSSIRESGSIRLYAITSSWSEATVTWNNQPPAEATLIANVDLTTSDAGGTVAIDVTAAVQRWADGSLADAGFLIKTSDGIKAFFDAKEKPAGIPATLKVETGAVTSDGRAIVLDFADPDDCIIDEPGHYVLDRSWLLTPDDAKAPNANCSGSIHISAVGRVSLDLGGYAIVGGDFWGNYEPVLWIDTESPVILRDGELRGGFVAIQTSVSSSSSITLDSIRTGGGVLLGSHAVTVYGGRFASQFETSLQIGAFSRVNSAEFSCSDTSCLSVHGSSVVKDCTFEVSPSGAPAIEVMGDSSIVDGNTFESWIYIGGNDNVVAWNISSSGSVEVSGTGNVIENNIGPDIVFDNSGNFFGNNRAKLPGGFFGVEGNVDWGGNATY